MAKDDEDIAKDCLAAFESEARDMAEAAGYRFRVRKRDGKSSIGTADFNRNRINVELVEGVVVKAWVG